MINKNINNISNKNMSAITILSSYSTTSLKKKENMENISLSNIFLVFFNKSIYNIFYLYI